MSYSAELPDSAAPDRAPVSPPLSYSNQVNREGCTTESGESGIDPRRPDEKEENSPPQKSFGPINLAEVSHEQEVDAPIYYQNPDVSEFELNLEKLRIKRRKQTTSQQVGSLLSDTANNVVLMPNLSGFDDPGDAGSAGVHPPLVSAEEGFSVPREEEEMCQPCEEALQPTVAKDPKCSTPQEWAEHNLTHLPFRSCRRLC